MVTPPSPQKKIRSQYCIGCLNPASIHTTQRESKLMRQGEWQGGGNLQLVLNHKVDVGIIGVWSWSCEPQLRMSNLQLSNMLHLTYNLPLPLSLYLSVKFWSANSGHQMEERKEQDGKINRFPRKSNIDSKLMLVVDNLHNISNKTSVQKVN